MARQSPVFRRWATSLGVASVAAVLLSPTAMAQDARGWITVLEPYEWSDDASRGIGVRPKKSIRVEGVAFQPGGVQRVLIDGRAAQLEARPGGEVRFVGYADTGTVPRHVEIAAYGSPSRPPVIRQFEYRPILQTSDEATSAEAWGGEEGFEGERYAVVIGISDYADPAITSLRYADDDARAFHDFLVSEAAGLGGFEPGNIRFLLNEDADTRAVRTALTTFLRQVTERDVVVIYLAGHGAPDPLRPEDYYLLTHDTEASNFAGTAISMNDIDEYVRELRARDIIVFTDACHSAAVSGGGVGLRSAGPNGVNGFFLERLRATAAGLLTFTASETSQYSQEGRQWGGGHGVFTYQLLRGLEGEADEDGDRIVTLGELVEYTRLSVRHETKNAQVPFVGSGSFDRSWPIAVVPAPVVAESPTPATRPTTEGTPSGAGATAPSTLPAVTGPQRERVPSADRMSAGGTFVHSLVIPGSGQFRTGRGWRGSAVFAGSVAAVTYGVLARTVTSTCREATVDGVCLSGQYSRIETERPHLAAGIATAGVLTLLGAIDALMGAKAINRDRDGADRPTASTAARLSLLPTEPVTSARAHDVRLIELRFR